jgi:hypothetical protein
MDGIQVGGEMNELLNVKMCSPMMIYLAILVTSGLSVYLTRSSLMRHNTSKMENLYNLYSLNELKFMIVFGLILFGLCQYNKTNLAWVFLLFPVVYLLVQNLIVHIHVSSAVQSAPKEVDLSLLQAQQYGLGAMGGGKVLSEETRQPMVPSIKQVDRSASTSVSQQLNGSPPGGSPIGASDGFGSASGAGSNFSYF